MPGTPDSEKTLEEATHTHQDVEKAGTTEGQSIQTTDPNIVDWDGDDDPEKPLNWPNSTKWRNVFTISALTLLTPFGSTMFAPTVPDTMLTFHSDNADLASFVVSVYVLGYAFGPLVIGPLSELYGRLWVYHVNTALFIVFNIACALAPNLSALIVFRFLAGFAGVSPLTIGAGTIADMFKQEERGRVMALWTFPVLIGPTIGPVAGSYLGEAAGWRWTFWFLAILSGVVFAACLLIQNETYPPTLLQKKTKKLQKDTGNTKLQSALQSPQSPGRFFLHSIIRPTKLLFLSPIVFFISLYIAVSYGYMYLIFTSLTKLFEQRYGFSRANVGLTFLGIGIGQFLGLLLFGTMSDKILKTMAKKNGGEMKPEYRLPPLIPGAIAMPVGLFWYGWAAQEKAHWIVPILGTVFVGLAMIIIFMPIGTYLVDAFTKYAASAMAANTVLRSLGGALLPLCGQRMYDKLGYGWGNSLLGFIALAMIVPMWMLIKYGERIRTHPRFQVNL